MNNKSVQRVQKIIENSCCSVDLMWKKRLLRKHSSCEEMQEQAKRCFGGHGRVIAKQLISILKEQQILQDFIEVGQSNI